MFVSLCWLAGGRADLVLALIFHVKFCPFEGSLSFLVAYFERGNSLMVYSLEVSEGKDQDSGMRPSAAAGRSGSVHFKI